MEYQAVVLVRLQLSSVAHSLVKTARPGKTCSFDKGNYRYVVYAGDGENGRKGVVVEQGGKRIADLRCQSDAMSRFDYAQLQKMGLSLDSRGLQLQ